MPSNNVVLELVSRIEKVLFIYSFLKLESESAQIQIIYTILLQPLSPKKPTSPQTHTNNKIFSTRITTNNRTCETLTNKSTWSLLSYAHENDSKRTRDLQCRRCHVVPSFRNKIETPIPEDRKGKD